MRRRLPLLLNFEAYIDLMATDFAARGVRRRRLMQRGTEAGIQAVTETATARKPRSELHPYRGDQRRNRSRASLVERKYSLRRCVRYLTLPGARMARRHGAGATLQSARKRVIIKEIQAAVARELAARSEVPKTLPQRIADLLRELHRRLRNPNEEAAPRLDPDRAHQPPKET